MRAQLTAAGTTVLSEAHLPRIGRKTGATWRCRTRTPIVAICVFRWPVLHSHTALTNLPLLRGKPCPPAADCQARQRVPRAARRRTA